MGAAMQNGVGGHAGLFSTANDVAKLMQMYLQNGTYGGENFIKPQTITAFNSCYYCDENYFLLCSNFCVYQLDTSSIVTCIM